MSKIIERQEAGMYQWRHMRVVDKDRADRINISEWSEDNTRSHSEKRTDIEWSYQQDTRISV